MSLLFSPLIPAPSRGGGGSFSVRSLELQHWPERGLPVVVLDDFRVRGQPFGPHPHAGFSAVTYVFEDSPAALRSRDSLGNDIVMGPGGIVWTQAGSGLMHEELPAGPDRDLQGLQVFVNLSSKSKLSTAQVLSLAGSAVPEWRSPSGDRVRVVVGSFEGISSPLAPIEPFHFLHVFLERQISFNLPDAHQALIYVRTGSVLVQGSGREQRVSNQQGLVVYGGGDRVTFEAQAPASFLILSGREIREPVLSAGPFIMNDQQQIEAAITRFRSGAMGRLERL